MRQEGLLVMKSSQVLVGAFVGLVALAGCAGGAPSPSKVSYAYPQSGGDAAMAESSMEAMPMQPGAAPADRGGFEAPRTDSRPGLGTQWGETRTSVISSAPFTRADSSSPFATAAVFYNDEQGAQAMASSVGFRRISHGSVDIGGGIATVSLKDGSGRFLSGFESGSKKFLVGEEAPPPESEIPE